MSDRPDRAEYVFRGRLGWLAFIKVCFFGVLGSYILVSMLLLLAAWGYSILAPLLGYAERDGMSFLDYNMHGPLFYGTVYALAWAILTGVLGYPLYWLWTRIRGGMVHWAYTGGAMSADGARQFLKSFSRCLVVLPAVIVFSIGIAVVMLVSDVPVYESRAMVLPTTGSPVLHHVDAHRAADFSQTQVRLIQSGLIRLGARKRMGISAEEEKRLLVRVSVSPVSRTSILKITVGAYDPVFAAEMANALLDEYVAFVTEAEDFELEVLERARPATSPSGMTIGRTLSWAACIGAGLGVVIALVWAAIKEERKLRNALG